MPLVTVNMLAHNRRWEVETALRTLHTLDYPAEQLEFIVVDNASTDGTAEMLRRDFPDVRVIENDNVGAAGWTRGFELGRGDYFLILDDDCYLEGDGLRRAVEAAEAEHADLVSFRVVSSHDRSFEFKSHYPVGLLSFWASAALISRQAIDELGGFDPNIFIWANELEFTIRLLDRGLRHLYLPDVTAVHMKPPPTGHAAEVYTIHMRHLAYVAAKLLRPRDAAGALAVAGLKLLLGLPLAPARWRALPAFLGGVRLGLRSRAPVREPVSSAYRRNLRDFSSPLFYLSDPVGLGRSLKRPGGLRGYLERHHRSFYASRPDYYPVQRASLRI